MLDCDEPLDKTLELRDDTLRLLDETLELMGLTLELLDGTLERLESWLAEDSLDGEDKPAVDDGAELSVELLDTLAVGSLLLPGPDGEVAPPPPPPPQAVTIVESKAR